jgi:hypothetical protein
MEERRNEGKYPERASVNISVIATLNAEETLS